MASWTWVVKRGGMMMTVQDEEAAWKMGLEPGTTVVSVPIPEPIESDTPVLIDPKSAQQLDEPTLKWDD